MKLRSLFLAVIGALILMAFIVPRANADCDTLLVYFNFEDVAPNNQGNVDTASDEPPGMQHSTLMINYGPSPTPQANFTTTSSSNPNTGPIAGVNRAVGDNDTTTNSALLLTSSSTHNNSYIQFAVDATFFTNMSLSYALNTNGNGFTTQTWQYSIDGGANFTTFHTFTGLTGLQTLSFALPTGFPTSADNQAGLVIRIVFSSGQSNGTDLQTVIDNIQLTGCVVPEPATVVGGLLGACGLCWHQRRRIRFILPRCGFRGLRRA